MEWILSAVLAVAVAPPVPVVERAAAVKVAETRVEIAQADLDAAQADKEYWAEEYERGLRLIRTRSMAPADFSTIRWNHVKAVVNHRRAVARLHEARALLEYARKTGKVDPSPTIR